MNDTTFSKGLAGVVAGETAISNVEGEIGRLTYRGYAIEELVGMDYLTVLWLVLFGELPTKEEQASLASYLAEHGDLAAGDLAVLEALRVERHPMQALQGIVPLLLLDDDKTFSDLDTTGSRGLQIIAKMPMVIATLHQLSVGKAAPTFDSNASYLGNFLTMFTGQASTAKAEEILKVVQILQMEHSFNAGTFATRVVSSTLAPVEAVFSAGIGTLAGVLHGGADEMALRDAYVVGSPENATAWVDELLARGGKLMGMGHREYRVVDPRSVILQPLAEQLCVGGPAENTYRTLQAMEAAFSQRMSEKGKAVKANLEFYKGAVYEGLGIPMHFFTAVFAMSRMVGWLAHLVESRRDNRIMRPTANYVGVSARQVG